VTWLEGLVTCCLSLPLSLWAVDEEKVAAEFHLLKAVIPRESLSLSPPTEKVSFLLNLAGVPG